MQPDNQIVVVTGAGGGIGRALAAKFCQAGAKAVVAVDINSAAAQETATLLGEKCTAMTADVTREEEVAGVIERTEAEYGPIDLFCSNAGVGAGASEQSANHEWQLCWDVNVMAHVYAARHLVPRMLQRGGGYFLNTASAAGLLNQIGAAYGVTKHAAVGFAEWLCMTYAHKGIKVSVLCPQAVRTAMTANSEDTGTQAASTDGMLEPDEVADIVLEHLERDAFLILTHPQVRDYMQRKATDYDRWVSGMNRLQMRLTGEA